ncbi:cytochrome ubiquinol oxidase subunit I, partial [Streptomyces sp. NPDC007162]|uniref:cytochrome ubiquinol oxidase subunit I n=1 Tax=Streptomyces sp. NPDC007162 TaxID=3156917 RepID=UPI0033CAE794
MDLALAPETLARWQFGITTVYHFLFVPLTISLAALTAGLQTAWVRTEKEKYLRATKFWGKLFLINIAMGVVEVDVVALGTAAAALPDLRVDGAGHDVTG